jgi:hypothetical protein
MKFRSLILHSSGGLTHHAYLVEGERELVLEKLVEFLAHDMGIKIEGNPDLLRMTFDVFGIDEGRRIKEMQASKAFFGNKRIFIIAASSFTIEAQNSLLKVFEEPAPDVHFFVIVPSADLLLPTLRSRFITVEYERNYRTEGACALAKKFLAGGKRSRLLMVKEIAENKDKEQAVTLLNELEQTFHAALEKKNGLTSRDAVLALEEIVNSKKYIGDRASSLKLILEHLALVLPSRAVD